MKIKILIKEFNIKNSQNLIKILKKKFILSPWIIDTIKKIRFKKNYKLPIILININLKKDLNIKRPTKLSDIHKLIKKNGYKLVNPEIAVYSSLYIKLNKPGIWIRFATPLNSLIDQDGIHHLPKVGCGLKKKYIETYWSYSNQIFHPHNDFIVEKK